MKKGKFQFLSTCVLEFMSSYLSGFFVEFRGHFGVQMGHDWATLGHDVIHLGHFLATLGHDVTHLATQHHPKTAFLAPKTRKILLLIFFKQK